MEAQGVRTTSVKVDPMAKRAQHNPPRGGRNRLAREKSPYLLQHADNPVDWYPWGEEAFGRARREDRPVFLSIGYSTCHWCHVMAHESFEDEQVAELMNDAFVSIKVDREERPDIDAVYMAACQMMTGSGGWPLTVIMTPDGRPFVATTYVPKRARFGRTGMLDLLPRVMQLWREDRVKLLESADEIAGALVTATSTSSRAGGGELGQEALDLGHLQLAQRFDADNGGFGTAPKFPSPHTLLFLLRYWHRIGDEFSLRTVERTLEGIRRGGIHDHMGGGFHRYSTDAAWLVPHFEKMLYDQALLIMAYAEAFLATGTRELADVVREVASYVLLDMTSPEGAFYSAEDADSPGGEGAFYVWTERELREALGDDDAALAMKVYNARPGGNYAEEASGERGGANILHLTRSLPELAKDLGTTEEALGERLASIRSRLLKAREARPRPHRDDKVLADWNGLMVAALSKASRALGEPELAVHATRAAEFVLGRMRGPDGRLRHRFRDGEAAVQGNLDDHAFMAWGLTELYESTLEPRWLEEAASLIDSMLQRFWDAAAGGLFLTPDDGEALLVRPKEVYDGALPSGNSVAAYVLLRLGRMLARPELEERAQDVMRAFAADVGRAPAAHAMMLLALDLAVGPAQEVVVVGDPASEDTRAMLRELRSRFLPRAVVLHRPPEDAAAAAIVKAAPYLAEFVARDGRATAYVCTQWFCRNPTTDVREMLRQIGVDG